MEKNRQVENYISSFEMPVQKRLKQLQKLIFKTVNTADEGFAYGMPSYKFKGKPLIYFAGYKAHIGVYALPNTHKQFAILLSSYKQGKGSVQFPNNEPLPLALISEMVNFRKTEIENSNS